MLNSLSPLLLKAGNLLIHLTNSLLLHRLLVSYRRLDSNVRKVDVEELALNTALLFSCHPLHVEPVVRSKPPEMFD